MTIDYKQLWAEVKQNSKTLRECAGPHDFQPIGGVVKLGTKYECTKCGGRVHGTDKHWYEVGLQHGKRSG